MSLKYTLPPKDYMELVLNPDRKQEIYERNNVPFPLPQHAIGRAQSDGSVVITVAANE